MKLSDIAKWVETAREQGCVRIVTHRARKNGGLTGLFDDSAVKGLDIEGLIIRMREDVSQTRRIPSAIFEMQAWEKDGKGPKMLERVTVSRDDEDEDEGGNPHVRMMAIMAAREKQTHDKMLDCVDRVLSMSGTVESIVKAYREKEGDMLTAVFEIASMQKDREEAREASKLKMTMAKEGIEGLIPIVGAMIAKASGKAGPAIMALFKTLKPEQVEKLQTILTPEQAADFGTIIELVEKDSKGEGTVP